nr:transforming acidic coiled-coil-containing protein 2-like [Salvelinus alpinus]
MSSTVDRDSMVTKSSLYTRTAGYGDGERESPYQPKDLDYSLGIAREEIVSKEKEVLEWQRKYEDSRQEVLEMRRIVSEYEKTIAQMIDDEQRICLCLTHNHPAADHREGPGSFRPQLSREKMRRCEEVCSEYLSRVRKEEQRYHALKIHAEEKLDSEP